MVDEVHTLEESGTNDNRYTFWCDAHEQRHHYCVCVKLLDAYENKRIKVTEELGDCAYAMKRGVCTAAPMRKEEETAGKPIYFLSRAEATKEVGKVIDRESDSYKAGFNKVSGTKVPDLEIEDRAPPPPSNKINMPDGNYYANAITKHAEKAAESKRTKKPIVTVTQGKSMLELAQEMGK
tara:strand:- start:4416 stop:4955 length:540 start_codon:yes stop_codon:yes gene_type:complete